jgi:lipoprotein-releasing system permease protein
LVALLVVWLRAMLVVSVLGLALGVASLFVVLGVASGVERLLVDSLARLNGHAMVSKYGLDFYESPFVFGVGAMVVVGQASEELEPVVVTIKGVDPEQLDDFSTTAELFAGGSGGQGNFAALRPADTHTRPGVVIGTRLARRLGARPGSIVRIVVPDSIRQDDEPTRGAPRHGEFEVLGLLDTGFAEFDASFVLVHISAAQALVFGQRRASGVEIELADARLGNNMSIATELAELLNQPLTQQGLLPLYRAASWADRSPTLVSIRQTKGIAIGGVGSLLGLAWGAVSLLALSLLRLELDADVYLIDHLPVAFVIVDVLIPTAIAVCVCAIVTGPVAWRISRMLPLSLLK